MEESISPITKHGTQLDKPDGQHHRFGRFVGAVDLQLHIVVNPPHFPAGSHILTHFLTLKPTTFSHSSAGFS